MLRRNRKNEKKLKQIGLILILTKIIGAVIIFYIGLSINVKNVGENILDNLQKDFFNINEEFNTGTNQEQHFAAGNDDEKYLGKFEDTCLSDTDLCDKISFYGSYDNKEKYNYLSESFGVINFIDSEAVIGSNFIGKINEIKINKTIGDRRGYATREDIVLNLGSVNNLTEFHDLISHELGHIFDLGYIKGKNKKMHGSFTEFGRSVFSIDDVSLNFYKISRSSEKTRKKEAIKKDFCSGYGMYDPFEDFAECFNLYLNHNALFTAMAQKNTNLKGKYNFIAGILGGKYIKKSDSEKTLIAQSSSWRPRDTTKVSSSY